MTNNQTICIVVLAAGASHRMGSPKQFLKTRTGAFLLEYLLTEALEIQPSAVIVLTGRDNAALQTILPQSHKANVDIIYNPAWESGMASSLKLGLQHAETKHGAEAVLFMLCDQPYVNRALLRQLHLCHQESRKPIVACRYANGVLGVPVLFARSHFYLLQNLEGDTGARKIVAAHQDLCALVDFPKGYIDLDSPEDYQQWYNAED
jgi:molybdenum cofactor cytidylyltransferase